MPGFYNELRIKANPIWAKIMEHPFIVEMREGSLPPEKFKFYLCQDHLFLSEFCRFLGMAVAKSSTVEQTIWFSYLLNATLRGEMEMHRRIASKLEVSEADLTSTKPTPTTQAYTSYLLRIASIGSLSEIVATMAPCPCSYLEIGERMLLSKGLDRQPLFKEWYSFYTSNESRAIVKQLIDFLDTVADEAGFEERTRMEKHFLVASKYEYLFWDMAYKMEEWTV